MHMGTCLVQDHILEDKVPRLTFLGMLYLGIVQRRTGQLDIRRSVQMDPIAFMKTIYLGDRACKKIILDGWNNFVKIQIDCISRIRDASGQWKFYNAEDIMDGYIVLSEVGFFVMDPPGLIPNDQIEVEVEPVQEESTSLGDPMYWFIFYVGHGGRDPTKYQTVTIKIKAGSVHLEDPSMPGVRITD